jgi:hypothetical protein
MSQRQRVGDDEEAVDGVPKHRSGYRKACGTEEEEPANRIAWTAGSNDRADEGAGDHTDEVGQLLMIVSVKKGERHRAADQ